MKRTEHYCDVCGSQMTRQDSDGEIVKVGITLIDHMVNPVRVTVNVQTDTASCHEILQGKEFCSAECFKSSLIGWVDKVERFFNRQKPTFL